MSSPFYLSAFVWNFAHGMVNLLVPLYALHVGMSGIELGSLVALPVVLQLGFSLLGGAYADRLGSKNVIHISCFASLGGAVICAFSAGYAGLFIAQCLFVLGRASFWPANWSLGSQLPGDRSRNMGRLNSVTNAGHIIGTAAAGLVLTVTGYREGFLASGAMAVAALALTALIQYTRKPPSGALQGILSTYRVLSRERSMYFAMACAFLSVLPFTVSASFHPVLLIGEGFTSDQIGGLLTLRSIGGIFAGIVLARLVRSAASGRVPAWCCATIGAGLAASALFPGAWAMAACLFILGCASGVVSIYFQLLISANSPVEQRGSAMSFGGVGWNVSNMITPILMGAFTDWLDVYYAFYIIGAVLLVYAAGLPFLHRWAFSAGRPREGR